MSDLSQQISHSAVISKEAVSLSLEEDNLEALSTVTLRFIFFSIQQELHQIKRQLGQLRVARQEGTDRAVSKYKDAMEEQLAAANRLIEALQSENDRLKRNASSNSREQQEEDRRESITSQLTTATIDDPAISDQLDLYRDLCGIHVRPLSDSNTWECRLTVTPNAPPNSAPVVFHFTLGVDRYQQLVSYRPGSDGESQRLLQERLPEYMRGEIEFGLGHLQKFFWRALDYLLKEGH